MVCTLPFTVTPAKAGVHLREGTNPRQDRMDASLRWHDVIAAEGIAQA